jgi:catechol-2,3-dioxygenase
VLGIFQVPELADAPSTTPGMHHMQLRHAALGELFDRYERLKTAGIVPHRTANHGPGTSFYYHDPDGNMVELSAANFDTEAEYLAYLASDAYRTNPSGLRDRRRRLRSALPPRHLSGRARPHRLALP